MEREILFRGKRVDGKGWIYGNLILPTTDNVNTIIVAWNGTRFKVNPKTIGQFTGLHDKNRSMIFDMDKVKDRLGHNGVVIWNQIDCSFSIKWGDDLSESLYKSDSIYFEVIGNIHDNG